jgi:hypothetical protein
MRGRIEDGQEVTIEPVGTVPIAVGDVVFVRWRGGYLLHLVKAIERDRVLIGNNLGKINGWAPRADVLGRCVTAAHSPAGPGSKAPPPRPRG